jgi:hypothetical protein
MAAFHDRLAMLAGLGQIDARLVDFGGLVIERPRQMRAVVVLPTPRTPVSIQAWAMRPEEKAFFSVRTIGSWPIRSVKSAGGTCAPEPGTAPGSQRLHPPKLWSCRLFRP